MGKRTEDQHEKGVHRISEVGPCDVLLGRGTGPNENHGNKLFRDILSNHKEDYQRAATRTEKRSIIYKALKQFEANGGRFVEKAELVADGSADQETDRKYKVVEGAAVVLKARQAFRYLLRSSESKTQRSVQPDEEESHATPSQTATPTTAYPTSIPSLATAPPGVRQRGGNRGAASGSQQESALRRLAALSVESPLLASRLARAAPYLASSSRGHQQQSPPIAGTSNHMIAANLIMNSGHSVLHSPFLPGGNTRVAMGVDPRRDIANDLVGGRVPLLSSMSPFRSRESVIESSLGKLLVQRNQLMRGGAPTSNIASDDALTRASRVVEQVAIEHAIEKYRLLEKMHSHHQLFSGAESLDPNFQALMRGIAADARPPIVRHYGDVDIRQKLLSELLCASRSHALGTQSAASQIQGDLIKASRRASVLQEEPQQNRQTTLQQPVAALPGGRSSFSTACSNGMRFGGGI